MKFSERSERGKRCDAYMNSNNMVPCGTNFITWLESTPEGRQTVIRLCEELKHYNV